MINYLVKSITNQVCDLNYISANVIEKRTFRIGKYYIRGIGILSFNYSNYSMIQQLGANEIQNSDDDEIQIIMGEEIEDQDELINKDINLPAVNQKREDDQVNIKTLLFLDEPGLQIYISTDPDLLAMLQWFIPISLVDSLLINVNHGLQQIIQREFLLQDTFEMKKFRIEEIYQYLGMNILFGIQRLPQVIDYWKEEQYLFGFLQMIMQEGRYKFIDDNFMSFFETSNSLRSLYQTENIRKKWKKLYKPDQELILLKHTLPYCTPYYLFDSATLFILDEAIIFPEQGEQTIQNMLLNYSKLNHVIYLSDDCLDISLICKLVENSIFPVSQISTSNKPQNEDSIQFLEQFEGDGIHYVDTKMCYVKEGENIFLCPQQKICLEVKDQSSSVQKYRNQLQYYLMNTREMIDKINLNKNPFCYQSQSQKRKDDSDDEDQPSQVIQYIKVLFEEYLECTIYNIFSYFNCILIENQEKQTYKQFKLAVAAVLIGESYQQLEMDRGEILRESTLEKVSKETQTDKSFFHLPLTFQIDEFHLPSPVNRSIQVKYCIVCMKHKELNKSYFHCYLCLKQKGYDVYPCLIPCFDLFHRNPESYMEIDFKFTRETNNNERYFSSYVQEKIQIELQSESIYRKILLSPKPIIDTMGLGVRLSEPLESPEVHHQNKQLSQPMKIRESKGKYMFDV